MAGTDPYGLFYSGSGITVIGPDQIRPPVGAGELVNPPGYGLRPTLLAPDMPGYNEVVAWVEALSAVAKSNAERGVNHGGGIVGALEQVAAFLQGYQEGGNDGAILILDHLTLGLVPGLNDAAEQIRTANAGSMAYTVADWSAAVGTTTLPGVGGLKALGIGAKAAKATKAAGASTAAIKASRAAQGAKTIGATGKIGEQALKKLGGKSQQSFRTSKGWRYVDQLVDGVAHESKVGYTTLNKKIQTQIQKDAELIRNKEIKGAVWHFFVSPKTGAGGPSAPLLEALRGNGIGVVIH
jgi:hypothetical protein